MPAKCISLERAREDKLFYVVANVVLYRPEDGRCLILKRSMREAVHPGRYAVPGGKLEWAQLDVNHPTRINGDVLDYQDAIEKLLEREVLEEAGVRMGRDLRYINSVAYVRPDGIPSILTKYAAEYLGGDVRIDVRAFDDFAWVNAAEVKRHDCIDGIHEEVAKTIALFRS